MYTSSKFLKNIKLHTVFLALVGVVALLLTFSLVVPDEGITIAGMNIKFPSFDQLLHPKQQEKADIGDIIMDVDTSFADPLIKHTEGSDGNMGAAKGGQLSINNSTSIHLNDAAKASLHAFFQKMNDAAGSKKKVHILHYGDSQIEGDRMTGFIRERIQNQFGGNGPGLVPAMNVYNTYAFNQTYSENFKRYTCFGGDKLKSRKYGAMASAARFAPEPSTDSAGNGQAAEWKTAWIELEASNRAYSRARSFSTVKMFYNSCVKPCAITVYENGAIIHQDSLIADGKYHVFKLSFAKTPGKLRYEFKSTGSPTISNFSLEGDIGVQVSNIGLRGSSGTIFGSMDKGIAGQMINDLNTELVIMQFGGNSVPSLKDSAGARNYASYFAGQLRSIKAMRPNVAIIVIGPSDMSMMKDGIYETYPLLPYLVDQMKKKSLEVGAGYWDLFNAMGGKNSMPAWVEKGLAGNDYIHFSNKGASISSQLFYDAFIAEYVKWNTGVQ